MPIYKCSEYTVYNGETMYYKYICNKFQKKYELFL